jgi:hypothetical protein
MSQRRTKKQARLRTQPNAIALAKSVNHGVPLSKRARGGARTQNGPFLPPEDWHEPVESGGSDYKVVVRPPGEGYRHVVTAKEVRARLGQLPAEMLRPLEVIQLSSMTRKKRSFPCYGMQWGASLYLYPIEEGLVEHFDRPPKPTVFNEVRMFGGRWQQLDGGAWKLMWTVESLKDFYLNNILIHELGHLLDDRNTGYVDRERYAEWFAIRHGYKTSQRFDLARRAANRQVRRRHHAS